MQAAHLHRTSSVHVRHVTRLVQMLNVAAAGEGRTSAMQRRQPQLSRSMLGPKTANGSNRGLQVRSVPIFEIMCNLPSAIARARNMPSAAAAAAPTVEPVLPATVAGATSKTTKPILLGANTHTRRRQSEDLFAFISAHAHRSSQSSRWGAGFGIDASDIEFDGASSQWN
jgi:hypothetical protein